MYVFALATGSVRVNGQSVTVRRGEVWRRDDPTVRAFPDLFGDVPPVFAKFPGWDPPVEAATAAPGEKRSTRRGG